MQLQDLPAKKVAINNLVFPFQNDWGVPDLLLSHQAEYYTIPCSAWGSASRKLNLNNGTLHFFVDDYRFDTVWEKPEKVAYTNAYAIVEPNYTVSLESPKAWALYSIFQRRWLARYWQSLGFRIYVDLNIPTEFADLMLLGVPRGWRAYATRGYSDRIEATKLEHELAINHAGTEDILFLVYGGGKLVQAFCKERNLYWVPEERDRAKGRFLEVIDG